MEGAREPKVTVIWSTGAVHVACSLAKACESELSLPGAKTIELGHELAMSGP